MNLQDKNHLVWQPIDFDAEVHEQRETTDRVAAIRAGIDADLAISRECVMYTGPVPSGRPLAEQVCENYRILLRRIDELEADIDDLLEPEPPRAVAPPGGAGSRHD